MLQRDPFARRILTFMIGCAALGGSLMLAPIATAGDETVGDVGAQAPDKTLKDGAHKNVARTLDHGVGDVAEPEGYRLNDFRSPVPARLAGAEVVEPEDARALLAKGEAIFIDVYPRAPKPPNLPKNTVWRDPPHMSIKGSLWLPNVGYGVLAPHVETYFRTQLERLTGNDKTKPLVFFCLKDCWMSWNAAKRALSWGYTSVVWFPDGTDGWQEIGERLVQVKPEKIAGS